MASSIFYMPFTCLLKVVLVSYLTDLIYMVLEFRSNIILQHYKMGKTPSYHMIRRSITLLYIGFDEQSGDLNPVTMMIFPAQDLTHLREHPKRPSNYQSYIPYTNHCILASITIVGWMIASQDRTSLEDLHRTSTVALGSRICASIVVRNGYIINLITKVGCSLPLVLPYESAK